MVEISAKWKVPSSRSAMTKYARTPVKEKKERKRKIDTRMRKGRESEKKLLYILLRIENVTDGNAKWLRMGFLLNEQDKKILNGTLFLHR